MSNILEKIYKSVLKLSGPLTSGETYEMIVKEAISLVGANYGSLVLMEEREFKDIYTTLPFKVVRRRKGFAYRTLKEDKVHVIYKKNKEFRYLRPELKALGVQSVILIPLSYRDKSIGVLIVDSIKKEHFSEGELTILLLFGSFVSLVLRKTQLYEETKTALELRDHFISLAAHELRTPLTTINGYAQLLYSKFATKDGSESRWIKELLLATKRLTQLVSELLDVNRIKTGRFQFLWKECNLTEVIRRAIEDLQQNYPENHIDFVNKIADSTDKVVGDFDKMHTAISNLLDNSAKFSPKQMMIHITLNANKKDFILTIRDHGGGINLSDLEKIYSGFYKPEHNLKEGIGVGLFLTKKIVEEHQGSLDINSKINKGTIVKIKLPKAKI